MRLYLDEDTAAVELEQVLRAHGHDVVTAVEAESLEQSDAIQMTIAARLKRAIVTQNHDDFEELNDLIHLCGGQHQGILVVRRENKKSRDMTPQQTAIALQNLLNAGLLIENQIHVLNHFR